MAQLCELCKKQLTDTKRSDATPVVAPFLESLPVDYDGCQLSKLSESSRPLNFGTQKPKN